MGLKNTTKKQNNLKQAKKMDFRKQIHQLASHRNIFFWGIILCVAVIRIVFCFSVPLYTTDVLRNLGYGHEFQFYGFQVYEKIPYDFSPQLYQFFWPNRQYSYPAVTLFFFAGLAKVWASIVFAKLILTLLDCLNSWLIYKITADRWCSLLYFLHPIGLWFVSHEGQFESMVNFFSLLAIWFLQKKRASSFFFISVAIQTKLFPVFFAPYFLYRAFKISKRFLILSICWGLLGFLPSCVAVLNCNYLTYLFFPGFVPKNNPITWALFQPGLHAFTPFWLVLSHWVAGIVFLGAILYFVRSEQRFLPYFAPFIFVVFVKANPIGQFWYMLIAPVLCLTVENPVQRRILMGLTLLFGVRSVYSMLVGPVGYVNLEEIRYVLELGMYGF